MLPCCDDGLSKTQILNDIINKPYEVFLNDFMFLLCQECKVLWTPPCFSPYTIHPMSPLSFDIRKYVRNSYKKIYGDMVVYWFNYIRTHKEIKENEEIKVKTTIKEVQPASEIEEVVKFIADDWKKGPGHTMEDIFDVIKFDKSVYGAKKDSLISENFLFRAYDDELNRRRSHILKFLVKLDIYKLLMEMLETSLCCIVLYEQGVGNAVTSCVTAMVQVFEEYFRKTGRSFNVILQSLSRLSAKLSHDNWSLDIANKIHEIFARDLMHFICNLHEIVWYPPNYITYKINRKSPLSLEIQMYIEKTLLNPTETNRRFYKFYGKETSVFKAYSFNIELVMEEISTAILQQVQSIEDVFMLILNTVRMSIVIHNREKCGVLTTTFRQLSEALGKCNKRNKGRIFDLFVAFAKLKSRTKMKFQKLKSLDAY